MAIRLTTYQKFQRDKMIRSLAIEQTGAIATLRRIQEAGLPMRKTDLLRTYREYAGIPEKEERIKYVRKDYRPSRDFYTEPEGFMSRRYRYRIKYETMDKRTGEIAEYYTSVIDDKPMSIYRAEQEAMLAIRRSLDLSPIDLLRVSLAVAEHRKGDEWD